MKYKGYKNQMGFTIKELLMVLVVIGLLCVAVIPQFFSMQNSRRRSEMEKVISVLQNILVENSKNTNQTNFPQSLDTQKSQTFCTSCFDVLLKKGISSKLWYKVSDTEYLFSVNGNHENQQAFHEEGDVKIIYQPTTGQINSITIKK